MLDSLIRVGPQATPAFQEGTSEYLFSFCSWKAVTVIFWAHTLCTQADYNPLPEQWGNPRKPAKRLSECPNPWLLLLWPEPPETVTLLKKERLGPVGKY